MKLRSEGVIHIENVGCLNFLGLRILDEYSLRGFAHGQTLQGTNEIFFRNIGLILNLFIRQLVTIIE